MRRSSRRRRTVTAFREEGAIIVAIPGRFTAAQEREWVAKMVADLTKKERRAKPSNAELVGRAERLSKRYLAGRAIPRSIAWVTNQNTRWGSCTPADRSIRLSTRLQRMPTWVTDYVLVHELAHLLEAGHNDAFWALVETFPRHHEARAFLAGYALASGLEPGPGAADSAGTDSDGNDPDGADLTGTDPDDNFPDGTDGTPPDGTDPAAIAEYRGK